MCTTSQSLRRLPITTSSNSKSPILILDFGSQYTQLIARRVREANVYSIILPHDTSIAIIKSYNPAGFILSGGPLDASISSSDDTINEVLQMQLPILAICYGMQLIAKQLGGTVIPATNSEYGHASIALSSSSSLFDGIEDEFDSQGRSVLHVWMSHSDSVTNVPPGFVVNVSGFNDTVMAMSNDQSHIYGLQFHPEVTNTKSGQRIINRFIHRICKCSADWTADNIIKDQEEEIRKTVGQDEALLAFSGGVDSLVASILTYRAINKQLHCVHIDTGLLRKNESEQVKKLVENITEFPLVIIDAKKEFVRALKKESNPEKKRKIIGSTFIKMFEKYSKNHPNIKWLVQGTIYPDIIESAKGSGKSKIIKSHHNVGGLPKKMKLKIIEPLSQLFKDEVKIIGKEFGLPESALNRHPFPGPGLAVRILGPITPLSVEIVREADYIFIEELIKNDLYYEVDQAFCVFIPNKTVGVGGDGRTYEYIIALRAVSTYDYMTATSAQLPHDFLAGTATKIVNSIPQVNRVVYDITSKPPATIEWE